MACVEKHDARNDSQKNSSSKARINGSSAVCASYAEAYRAYAVNDGAQKYQNKTTEK